MNIINNLSVLIIGNVFKNCGFIYGLFIFYRFVWGVYLDDNSGFYIFRFDIFIDYVIFVGFFRLVFFE